MSRSVHACLTCTPETAGPLGSKRKRGKTRHISGVCATCRAWDGVRVGWQDGHRIVTVTISLDYRGRGA